MEIEPMPIPKPHAGESQDEFHSRCMGNETMVSDYPDTKQRNAVCFSSWDEMHGSHPKPKGFEFVGSGEVLSAKVTPPSVDRAWSTLTVKSVDAEQRVIEGVASTPSVDRIGDIVEPLGAKFTLPIPLLHHHKHDQPVGHVIAARTSKDGISIKAQFAKIVEPGSLKDRIDTAWGEVKAGLVKGLSIGFKPLEYEPLDTKNPFGGLRFKTWSWYELSLVAIPANAEANISVVKTADQAATGHKTTRPGASGTKPISLKLKERTMSKTISEQLEALTAKRAANETAMNAIMAKAMDEGRSTDDSERDEFDGLSAEVSQLDGDIKRYQMLERANQAKAQPVTAVKTVDDGAAVRGNGPIRVQGPRAEPGIRFARMAKALCMAQGNREGAARIAEQLWGDDQQMINVMKAGVGAATVADPVYAGNLVTAVAGEAGGPVADFAEFLRPKTVIGKFGTNGVPALNRVPFRVGLLGETAGGEGYWVGEGQPKPVTSTAFVRTVLEPLKVANIAVITEELARESSPSAEVLIRDTLAGALIARLDTDFLDPAKGPIAGISPASITNGVTPIASSGITVAAVGADIAAVLAPFIAANNVPSSGVWIMSTTTALSLSLMLTSLGNPAYPGLSMSGGTFQGLPVIVSDYVPGGGGSPGSRMVIIVNANDIFLGDDGGVRVDISREASLEMSNTPTNAMSGAGGSPLQAPVATTMTSLWQTDSIGLRAERIINWKKRRASAVQMLSNVVWGT
jgi:HK97 family phage major capsid protein/HK97 family phage prohead protease